MAGRRDGIRNDSRFKGKGKKKGGKGGPKGGDRPLSDPLTRREARKESNAEARAEYGPTIRAAKQELAGSRYRQNVELPAWYGGAEQSAMGAAAQTDASYNQANAALQAHMKAAQDAAMASQGQIASQQAATAALTGSDPSLQLPALQEGAAAAGQRQIAGAALAAPISQAGASQAAFLRNTGLNAGRAGLEARRGETRRQAEIKEDITALRKERKQSAQGKFADKRGKERDYGVQLRAFPLQEQEMALDAEDTAFDNEISARNAATSERNAATSEKSAANSGGSNGPSASEKRGKKAAWNSAKAAAQTLFERPKGWKSWAELTRALQKEAEVSPAMARKAVQQIRRKVEREERGGGGGPAVPDVSPF